MDGTENNRDATVYRDNCHVLGRKDGKPFFTAGGKTYYLSCHPYEPCTYIRDGGTLVSVIHKAFDPDSVMKAFAKGNTVDSITGKVYDAKEFCEMLSFAVNKHYDTDIGYVEGAMAVEKLKALGATSPETAVDVKYLGVRTISDRFSHSRKLTARVMYTGDGKAYLLRKS